ncbi:MAG: DUF2163 domain-containing protein, partial [Bacillota bacterium]|nr:DUF2163 domain-containing protein [Bacillota bacterium]
MKDISQELMDLLNPMSDEDQEFIMQDLYVITLVDGTIFRCTSADRDLMVGGNVYLYNWARLERDNIRA